MTSIRTSIYEKDATTLIAHLPRQAEPQMLEELNGDGSGSFQISIDDTLLQLHPTLLAGGNVVKMRVTNAPDMDPVGWIIDDAVPTRTDSGGRAARLWTVNGRGMRAKPLSTGQVYPWGGLRSVSGDNRAFDFSSPGGDPMSGAGDWAPPVPVRWDLETTHRSGYPTDWPDTNAYWLWSVDPETPSDRGRNWFRTTFTLGAAGNVGVWAAGDNVISVRIDGDEVIASDFIDPYAWQKMFSWTGALAAGEHTLAAWCHNTGDANPAGFICVAATLDSDGIPVTLLARTTDDTWDCHGYAPPTPGWAHGQILQVLADESIARGEMGGTPVTLSFDDATDSAGHAWLEPLEVTVPVSASLLDVVGQLTDLGLDTHMAHDYTLSAWMSRGTDLSSSLTLRPGRDVEANTPSVRSGIVVNSVLMRHGTGWKRVEDATSIAANGRLTGSLSTGGTDSETQVQQTAEKFFTDQAKDQVTLPFTISSATVGPKPYRDFNLGDILSVPGPDGAFIPARCISIATSQPQAGLVRYETEFNPNLDSGRSPAHRHPRMAFFRALPALNRAVPGAMQSRLATPVPKRLETRTGGKSERFVFSKAGAADTTASVAFPVVAAAPLRAVIFSAKTSGSTDSVLTVYVDGVSVGTVTLPAGDPIATASLDGQSVPAGSLVTVAVTTVGTGLADVTAIVDTRAI